MANGGNSFKISREMFDLVTQNREIYQSVLDQNKKGPVGFKVKLSNPASHIKTKIQDNGDLQVQFIFALDNNEVQADGQILLEDTFLLDQKGLRFKKFQGRKFSLKGNLLGEDKSHWEGLLKKYQPLEIPPQGEKSAEPEAFKAFYAKTQAFSEKVLPNLARTIPEELLLILENQVTYLSGLEAQLQNLAPHWHLVTAHPNSTLAKVVRREIGEIDFILRVVAQPALPQGEETRGPLYRVDKFTLSSETGEMLEHKQEWEVGREFVTEDAPQKLAKALNRKSNTKKNEAEGIIRDLLPALIPGSKKISFPEEVKKAIRPHAMALFQNSKPHFPNYDFKGKDPQSGLRVLKWGGGNEVMLQYTLDDDNDPENGRVYVFDSFLLDPDSNELLIYKRRWAVAPEVPHDSKIYKSLLRKVQKLNLSEKEKTPDPAMLRAYIQGVIPHLPAVDEIRLDEEALDNVQEAMTPDARVPSGSKDPFIQKWTGRERVADRREANFEALTIMYAVAQEKLAMRADRAKGWMTREENFDYEGEKTRLDQVFLQGQKESLAKNHADPFSVLTALTLDDAKVELYRAILKDNLLQRINFIGKDPDGSSRAKAWMKLAERDLWSEQHLLQSAAVIAEYFQEDPGVQDRARALLAVAKGEGSRGQKLEYLTPILANELADWKLLGAMVVAPFGGVAAEAGALRLLGGSHRATRIVATGLGLAGEGYSFISAMKLFESLSGDPDRVLSWSGWAKEGGAASILFGLLRLTHWMTGVGITSKLAEGSWGKHFGKVPAEPHISTLPTGRVLTAPTASQFELTALGKFSSGLLHHAGGVGAMWGANVLNSLLGLQVTDQDPWRHGLLDAGIMYFHAMAGFNIANRLTGGRLQTKLAELRMELRNYDIKLPASMALEVEATRGRTLEALQEGIGNAFRDSAKSLEPDWAPPKLQLPGQSLREQALTSEFPEMRPFDLVFRYNSEKDNYYLHPDSVQAIQISAQRARDPRLKAHYETLLTETGRVISRSSLNPRDSIPADGAPKNIDPTSGSGTRMKVAEVEKLMSDAENFSHSLEENSGQIEAKYLEAARLLEGETDPRLLKIAKRLKQYAALLGDRAIDRIEGSLGRIEEAFARTKARTSDEAADGIISGETGKHDVVQIFRHAKIKMDSLKLRLEAPEGYDSQVWQELIDIIDTLDRALDLSADLLDDPEFYINHFANRLNYLGKMLGMELEANYPDPLSRYEAIRNQIVEEIMGPETSDSEISDDRVDPVAPEAGKAESRGVLKVEGKLMDGSQEILIPKPTEEPFIINDRESGEEIARLRAEVFKDPNTGEEVWIPALWVTGMEQNGYNREGDKISIYSNQGFTDGIYLQGFFEFSLGNRWWQFKGPEYDFLQQETIELTEAVSPETNSPANSEMGPEIGWDPTVSRSHGEILADATDSDPTDLSPRTQIDPEASNSHVDSILGEISTETFSGPTHSDPALRASWDARMEAETEARTRQLSITADGTSPEPTREDPKFDALLGEIMEAYEEPVESTEGVSDKEGTLQIPIRVEGEDISPESEGPSSSPEPSGRFSLEGDGDESQDYIDPFADGFDSEPEVPTREIQSPAEDADTLEIRSPESGPESEAQTLEFASRPSDSGDYHLVPEGFQTLFSQSREVIKHALEKIKHDAPRFPFLKNQTDYRQGSQSLEAYRETQREASKDHVAGTLSDILGLLPPLEALWSRGDISSTKREKIHGILQKLRRIYLDEIPHGGARDFFVESDGEKIKFALYSSEDSTVSEYAGEPDTMIALTLRPGMEDAMWEGLSKYFLTTKRPMEMVVPLNLEGDPISYLGIHYQGTRSNHLEVYRRVKKFVDENPQAMGEELLLTTEPYQGIAREPLPGVGILKFANARQENHLSQVWELVGDAWTHAREQSPNEGIDFSHFRRELFRLLSESGYLNHP